MNYRNHKRKRKEKRVVEKRGTQGKRVVKGGWW